MEAQPPPHPWWIDAIETAKSVWEAFIVPTALGLWAVARWRASRKDARFLSDKDENAKMRDGLDARTLAWVDDRAKGHVEDLARRDRDYEEERTRRLEAERDRARLEVQAQGWFNAAHDTWHSWAQVLTTANGRLERAGLEPVPGLPHLTLDRENPP